MASVPLHKRRNLGAATDHRAQLPEQETDSQSRSMDYSPFERDGIILAREVLPFLDSHRRLRRDVSLERLVRVRRGAYALADTWRELPDSQRHLCLMRAVAADARRLPVFAGHSAAVLWGMPLDTVPSQVLLLDVWRGGGRSEADVRRTARAAKAALVVRREGLTCTDLARTALDLARVEPFANSVAYLDWSLWRSNPLAVTKSDLLAELRRSGCPARVERAVAVATHLSDSPGESKARVAMLQLGFPEPDLQVCFTDQVGSILTDFAWPRYGVAGEFDGKVKYTRNEFTRGDPSEVVWREKKREDRLRQQVRTVVRITTADVERPHLLAAKLVGAGIPRSSRGGR